MLITESQLRRVIRKAIILEEKKTEEGLENNEELASVADELQEVPTAFFSKLEKAIDKDIEDLEEQPVGDEGFIIFGTAMIVSGPLILKGLKWSRP